MQFTKIPAKDAVTMVVEPATEERYTLDLSREDLAFLTLLMANVAGGDTMAYELYCKGRAALGLNLNAISDWQGKEGNMEEFYVKLTGPMVKKFLADTLDSKHNKI